ncbi:MAG: M20 metallopeptidase family protein, partial [Planctomycetota bacterium]
TRCGYSVTTGVGGTGVVGVLANGSGPTILVRGDMDALPVTEETGLEYASKVKVDRPEGGRVGVMHACGHDVHTTALIGTAKLLSTMREQWRGTLVMIAQPAEEIGRGAQMMIQDGLFTRFPRPDLCISLHVTHKLPVGQIGYTPGWAAANVDSVDITIFGRGGHGARPNATVDPVVAAAHVVTNLQTLVSRRVDPVEPAVVTVGSIHGGSKHNIIPNEVKLQLTVRSYTDQVRSQLLEGIRQIATDICRAHGCPQPPHVAVRDEFTPAAYNDPALTFAAADSLKQVFGEENVLEQPAEMGGEDFGRYAAHLKVPGLQIKVGSISREAYQASQQPDGPPLPSLHSSKYAPVAEPTLRGGVRAMAMLALSLLAPGGGA